MRRTSLCIRSVGLAGLAIVFVLVSLDGGLRTQTASAAELKEEKQKLPLEPELQVMVESTLAAFNRALERNDFETFYASLSDRWKYRGKDPRVLNYFGKDPRRIRESDPENHDNRITVTALRRAFEPLRTYQLDLSPVMAKDVIFDAPPSVNADGVLRLEGHCNEGAFVRGVPRSRHDINFKLEYVFERTSWRLFGIAVTAEPHGQPKK